MQAVKALIRMHKYAGRSGLFIMIRSKGQIKKKKLDYQTLPHLSKQSCIYNFFQWEIFFQSTKIQDTGVFLLAENYFNQIVI